MRTLFILLSLLCISSGCAPTPSETTNTNADTTSQYKNNISALYGNGAKVSGGKASNIIWKDSLGVIQSLDSLRGKIVLLNFWATWCGPCAQETPDLESIAESMGPDVVIIGVSVLDQGSALFDRTKLFAEDHNLKYQVIVDPNSRTYLNYGGDGTIPWTFAIDRDGNIVHKFVGAQTKNQFMNVVNQIP